MRRVVTSLWFIHPRAMCIFPVLPLRTRPRSSGTPHTQIPSEALPVKTSAFLAKPHSKFQAIELFHGAGEAMIAKHVNSNSELPCLTSTSRGAPCRQASFAVSIPLKFHIIPENQKNHWGVWKMSICSCGAPIRESLTIITRTARLKSCPQCSGRAGHHVFYREGTFGMRNMGGGREIIQSWCPECRGGNQPTRRPDYECV